MASSAQRRSDHLEARARRRQDRRDAAARRELRQAGDVVPPAFGRIAWCRRCDLAIEYGEPYMPRIPFVGSWGGFVHQNCPPTLTLVRSEETQ